MSDSDIRMAIYVERSSYGSEFLHVTARPVKMRWSEQDNENMPYGGFYVHEGDPYLERFEVHAQGDIDSDPALMPNLYGWSVGYREMRVTLYEAEPMVKLLRKVDRGLTKLAQELGYATTFGQYIARVAKILKIDSFGFRPVEPGRRTWPNGFQFEWTGATLLDSYINERIKAIRNPAVAERS